MDPALHWGDMFHRQLREHAAAELTQCSLAGVQERVVVLLASKASHKHEDVQTFIELQGSTFSHESCLIASRA